MKAWGNITKRFTIWCGGDDCMEMQHLELDTSRKEAEIRWRDEGWRRIEGKWHCPKCVKRVGKYEKSKENT